MGLHRNLATSLVLSCFAVILPQISCTLSVYGNALGIVPPGGLVPLDKTYAAVIDQGAQMAYYCGYHSTWLSKVDLTTMAVVDQLQLADTIYNAVIDEPNGKAYFSTLQNPGNIYKINLATFTVESTLANVPNGLYALCLDQPNQFLYAGNEFNDDDMNISTITKIDLGTFQVVAQITTNPGETLLRTCVVDSEQKVAWFVEVDQANVIQVDLATFQISNRKLFDFPTGFYSAGLYGATHELYLGVVTVPGMVLKTNKDFTINQAATLTQDEPRSVIIDQVNGIAYFGSSNSRVSPVDLKTFTPLPSLRLPIVSDVNIIYNMLIDQQGFLYASTQRRPRVGPSNIGPDDGDETQIWKIQATVNASPTPAPTMAPTTKKVDKITKKMQKKITKQTKKQNNKKTKHGHV